MTRADKPLYTAENYGGNTEDQRIRRSGKAEDWDYRQWQQRETLNYFNNLLGQPTQPNLRQWERPTDPNQPRDEMRPREFLDDGSGRFKDPLHRPSSNISYQQQPIADVFGSMAPMAQGQPMDLMSLVRQMMQGSR